jgi:hypothetical protein
MKTLSTQFCLFFILIVLCGSAGCGVDDRKSAFPPLSGESFANPPIASRPGVLWPWLNAYTDRKQLMYELQQMKAKGLRGVIIWDIGSLADPKKMIPVGPEFLGSESVETIRMVMDECSRLGLEAGLVASSSWNAGGSWIGPEDASKAIISSDTTLAGPAVFLDSLPLPKGTTKYFSEVAVFAVPVVADQNAVNQSAIRDLSSAFQNGVLNWQMPEGSWKIIRFICNNTGQPLMCPSPNSVGPMIDHLSAKAADAHVSYMINAIRGDRKDLAGLKYLMLDSYEVDPANDWTPDFLSQFSKLFGYDAAPYLPALAGVVVDNPDVTARFLHDYHKAVGEMLVTNHFLKEKEILHKNGLLLLAEAGHGGYARTDALKALGLADVPMGEFWNGSEFWVTKEAASASHIYGNNLVNAESLTGWRAWKDGPAHYKRLFDVALCEGLNQPTFHTFTHNPAEAGLPGFVYHAGEHFNVNSTWWEYSAPMLKYMSRCCYLLQQGQFVGDLCLYYGDQAHNLVPPRRIDPNLVNRYDSTQCGHCDQLKPVNTTGLGLGYDYDYVNEDVILNRMTIEDGRLTLPRELSYKVMVLPDKTAISLAVLQKLEKLISAGAVVFGPKPVQTNSLLGYPDCDAAVRKLADKIWGDCDGVKQKVHAYGKGRVYCGMPLWQVMRDEGIPQDFKPEIADNADQHIDYIHRRNGQEEIYFVSNSALVQQNFVARFRVGSSRVPKLWQADDGTIRKCKVIEAGPEFTRIELSLPPAGSVFVIFGSDAQIDATVAKLDPIRSSDAVNEVMKLTAPWKIAFPAGRGAPDAVVVDSLTDWSLSKVDGIRYFSGTATYSANLEMNETMTAGMDRLELDLGTVKEIAVVRINGIAVDTLWKVPYRTAIGRFLKPGANLVEIDVTNTWHNRLVGDAGKEQKDRVTRTNIQDRYRPNMPLLPSGLIGPVTLKK